ncbi:hypothetical protein NLG97_g3920 [Lecanicillium saksenae]|uniref:Uncharacterized protein n=1 Tax=Lecanicillium saksenae TaxID=468837 RepID=A0ACC1QY39_9HYPO|nr:hypothetical protein NLG97_g3920 [Lecanicillium saksenae]
MVGVPGRSKACNTCLQRKIKCDLGKPICDNCTKSKRICGGYVRKTAYVFSDNVAIADGAADDGTLIYQGRWKATVRRAPVSAYGADPLSASRRPRFQWQNDVLPGAAFDIGVPDFGALDCQRVPMMPSLWQQLHHVFMSAYMPRIGMTSADKAGYVTGNWMMQLQSHSSALPALQMSIAAFASAQIAHDHNDRNLLAQSMQFYLKSLEHLRNAIANPTTRLSDDTLAACLALGIYELTEKPIAPRGHPRTEQQRQEQPNGSTAYSAHMTGAMMLLKLRGPDANNTPLAHSLFLGLRRQVIITTLIKHSDTFLSHDMWRECPWNIYPKNVLDKCLDCVLDLPRLQRLADEMLLDSNTTRVARQCDMLIEQCTALLANLEAWYTTFKAQMPGPPFWSTFCTLDSQQDDPILGKPFPVSYVFPSFSAAYLLMTYWTGIMVSHWLLFVAYRTLVPLAEQSALEGAVDEVRVLREKRQMHKDAWVGMTRNMCQMTEYFLSKDMGKVSITVALAVLEGAMAMFRDGTDDWEREKAWVAEMIGVTANRLNETSMVVTAGSTA